MFDPYFFNNQVRQITQEIGCGKENNRNIQKKKRCTML